MLLVFTLTSWLYVAGVVAMFVYSKSKDSGVPESIRAYRWKLKNVDMSFEDMVREVMKLSENYPRNLSSFEIICAPKLTPN